MIQKLAVELGVPCRFEDFPHLRSRFDSQLYQVAPLQERIRLLRQIAEAEGMSIAQLAIAFMRDTKGVTSLVLDFESLAYISSAGLRVILFAIKAMKKQGKMVVKNVNETVMEVFEITGFADMLTIE